MAEFIFPFDPNLEPFDSHEDLDQCNLYRMLPDDIQEACRRNIQLLEYLHMFPIDELGIPDYYPEVSRKLGDLKHRNLLYPVTDDIHIHIMSSGEERDFYIPIEPSIGVNVSEQVARVEVQLVEID